MWKEAFLSLVAVLSSVQGTYRNGLGVPSWDQMLADIMQSKARTGVCAGMCYIIIGEDNHLLKKGETFIHRSSDPCLRYTCESYGVKEHRIKCPAEVTCNNGPPVRYPSHCCQQCVGIIEWFTNYEDWSPWTECSRTCDGGKQARERIYHVIDSSGVLQRTAHETEVRECQKHPCPVNCEWKWEDYEQCSASCGGGTMSRIPIITQHSKNGGRPCPPKIKLGLPEKKCCNSTPCPVPCLWEWGDYEQCTVTCGRGTRSRYPIITQHPQHRGRDCPPNVKNGKPETVMCNLDPCPDCIDTPKIGVLP